MKAIRFASQKILDCFSAKHVVAEFGQRAGQ
jgi:hypothetical protein